MLRLLSLSCFLLPCLASVLMEVSFDLALQQESETGYTASHTVSEYIKDTNLLWMRYLNTLVSGTTGNAPMRTAFMEFDSYADWAAFEDKHLERTHVLYDLFWINWKRYLWEGMPESNFHPRERGEDNGGYTYIFRYSVRDGSEADAQKYFDAQNAQLNKVLQENEQFIERRVYKNGPWQDEYQFMVLYEFGSMEALSKTVFENPAFGKVYEDAKNKFLSNFATTIMVPSAGSHGGQIFKGGQPMGQNA